jgi:hypothetical protein
MNFYPHHIGDFNSGTLHMERLERWIYRDMLEKYYDQEKPLPADIDKVCRLIGIRAALEPHRLCLKCIYLGGAADARRCANWRVTDMRGNAIPAELIGLLQLRAGFIQCAGLALISLVVPLDEWLAGLAPLAEDGDE